MWGIVPAAGVGSRIQPLAFSKELLPVGSRLQGSSERPRAVSEYLVERLILGGADRICFVISPGKSDILEYYANAAYPVEFCYAVQARPAGLCDALFRALPMIHPSDTVAIGLPDTVWFPEDGFCALPDGELSFLLFPVQHPEFFVPWSRMRLAGFSKSKLRSRTPIPGGFGVHSKCQAVCSTNFMICGVTASLVMNTWARS